VTAANPEPTDGSWAAPAGSGANPASGDGTWTTAGASPADPPAFPSPDATGHGSAAGGTPAFGSFAQLDPPDAGRPAPGYGGGPWSTPPAGWQPPGAAAQGSPGQSAESTAVGAERPESATGGPSLGAAQPVPDWPAAGGMDAAYPGGPYVPGPDAYEPPTPRMPLRQRLGAAGLTAAVVAVVGAPLGLLWAVIAPGVPIIKTDDGAVFATPSPEEFIASDGWFTILLFALGVVAALVTWIGFKRFRGPWTLAALIVGTIGASVLAWQVGRRIGIGDYHDKVLAASPGELITRPPDLRAGGFTKLWDVIPFVHGDLLIATFGAVIIYTLLAGWSRTPTLRPEPALPQPAVPANPYYSLAGPNPSDGPGGSSGPDGPSGPGGSGGPSVVPGDPADPSAPGR